MLQRSGSDRVVGDSCFDDILLLGRFFLELCSALYKVPLCPGRPDTQGGLQGCWWGKPWADYSPHLAQGLSMPQLCRSLCWGYNLELEQTQAAALRFCLQVCRTPEDVQECPHVFREKLPT